MRAMASEVSGKPFEEAPDIKESGMLFELEIRAHYRDLGTPLSPESSDMIRLTESLTSVLSPLYQNVHSNLTLPESRQFSAESTGELSIMICSRDWTMFWLSKEMYSCNRVIQ